VLVALGLAISSSYLRMPGGKLGLPAEVAEVVVMMLSCNVFCEGD
jgi:hypothetical protein